VGGADQAQAEVHSLESSLERRKLDLSYAVLRAPFDGVVSAVFAEVFEEFKSQQSVMRVIDPKKIEMVVNVPESLISLAPYATDIKVTPRLPQVVDARVDAVDASDRVAFLQVLLGSMHAHDAEKRRLDCATAFSWVAVSARWVKLQWPKVSDR